MYQLSWMLRGKNKWLLIAKILNVISLIMLFFILLGGLVGYDWSSMPYEETSMITFGGALFSVAVFSFITFTLAFSYYALRRVSSIVEIEQKDNDHLQEQ
jgi:hypothetical protein